MSNLQTYYHFQLDFQKGDRHTGGKWLIRDTKRRKNSCKAWNSPVAYPRRVCKHDIKESEDNLFSPTFEVQGRNIHGVAHFAEQILLSSESVKSVVPKETNGHRKANLNHTYHDENHDALQFYQGISKRST